MRRASPRVGADADADRPRAPTDGLASGRNRSPASPSPHPRSSAPALASRYVGSALLLGLVLLGVGLYWYGTVLQNDPL
jgi:hypothetical protein